MTASEKLRAFIKLSKPFKFLTMIFPFLFGTVLALWEAGQIDIGLFLLSFTALMFAVECVYVQNDLADYETDRRNSSEFTGGSKALVQNLVTPKEAKIVFCSSGFMAVVLGLALVFVYKFSWEFYMLCLFLFILAYGYTGAPFRFAYRGLGEVVLAFTNSTAPILIAYWLQTRHFSLLPIVASLPYAVAVFAQKILREFPDYEPDALAGKRNLVVRFGKEKMARVYRFSIYLYQLSVILVAVYLRAHGASWVLLLPSVYLAYEAYKISKLSAKKNFHSDYELLKQLNAEGFKLMFDTNLYLMLGLFADMAFRLLPALRRGVYARA